MVAQLATLPCPVLIGPRSGSKTAEFSIPPELAPGPIQNILPIKIVRVESLRAGVEHEGDGFRVTRWLEHVETNLSPELSTTDGIGVLYRSGHVRYLAAWPDAALLERIYTQMARDAGLSLCPLPQDLRMRRFGTHNVVFNYGPEPIDLVSSGLNLAPSQMVLGTTTVAAADVAVYATNA